MANRDKSLFSRLTTLFRSGPLVKRRVKNFSGKNTSSSALESFKRAYNDVYNSTISAYGQFDRMSRYSDFSEMESTPEIASALDIYSEETVSPDDKGEVLHIYSENRKLQELLETLFYDTLNVDFNLVMWVRNLCKYGDFFLFNDVSPEYGVINCFPIPISEIEREDGFDKEDPMAVRYRWITQGNQVLENWQISHFRLLGNDAFLPYGSSVLESARRIWRQLILIEDAMLVYRVIRAPERRVFYIDVGNVPPENVADYIEQAQTSLKRNQVVDKSTGKVDLRYNPLSVDEDYYIPVRGGDSGTRIDTLAGGQNTAAIEDVEYIQKKLFAALKIPRAYLGYDEEVGSKATLAQEDIRFSRTIQRIQKTVLSELNKLAMIHLFSHGYEGEDLLDFELKLSNPSSIAQQQKLELIRTKFDIAGSAPDGLLDKEWVRKNVMGLRLEEIEAIEEGRIADKLRDLEVENAKLPEKDGGKSSKGDDDSGDDGGDDEGGGTDLDDLFAGDVTGGSLLVAVDKKEGADVNDDPDEDDDLPLNMSMMDDDAPAKAEAQIRNMFNEPIKKSRKTHAGPSSTHMPDFAKMTAVGKSARHQDTMNDPFEEDFLKKPFSENFLPRNNEMNAYLNTKIVQNAKMTNDLKSTLKSLRKSSGISKKGLLSEALSDGGDELEIFVDENGNILTDGEDT